MVRGIGEPWERDGVVGSGWFIVSSAYIGT